MKTQRLSFDMIIARAMAHESREVLRTNISIIAHQPHTSN